MAWVNEKRGDVSSDEQNAILDEQLDGLAASKTARTVWSFATPLDIVVIALSCLAAIVAGALNPLLTVLYGRFVGSFDEFRNNLVSKTTLKANIAEFSLYFVYLAIGMFVAVYLTTVGLYFTGERITKSLRRAYLKNIVRQNMAFFDTLGAGALTTHITSDITSIQEGLTGNLSVSLTAAATCVSAFVICFIYSWKLGLVVSCTVVVLAGAGALGVAYPVKWTKASQGYFNAAATVAEEGITSIRHVTAFGIQTALTERYDGYLKEAERPTLISNFAAALMNSVIQAVPFLSYGLSFWEGSRLFAEGEISISGVTTVTLAIVIGAWAIGRVAPNAKAFIASISSAAEILKYIARRSPQDPFSEAGVRPDRSDVDITFRQIELVYPSRREVTVLRGFDLTIPTNKTTALVGASGCGKSSIIGLLERFYVPTKGEIALGQHNIQDLNLKWLRSQMSLVGQEPCLFDTTIFENIAYGLEALGAKPTAVELNAMVKAAAKTANADVFISSLPQGYETRVGERGTQLSGGQRQRICIARAVIRNPQILLLDEATAALDVEAERAVQTALAEATKGRTTIVIAHKLSTIRDADNIVVMDRGVIVEQGTHDSLIAINGQYAALVAKQRISEHSPAGDTAVSPAACPGDYDSGKTSEDILEQDLTDQMTQSSTPGLNVSSKNSSLYGAVKLIHRLNKPELPTTVIAVILSFVAGISVPAQSVIFAKVFDALSSTPLELMRRKTDFWCLMYLAIGLAMFAVWLLQGTGFAYTTAKLTHRGQYEAFRYILRQDLTFFEAENNSVGSLTALLSSGPNGLTGLGGPVMGAIVSFVATILGGIVISLIIGWKLALVCTATIPIVAGFGWVRLAVLNLVAQKMKKTHQDSAAFAGEAASAIRTVASLSLENHVLDHYNNILEHKSRESIHSILHASALYAASQSVTFLCAALVFWYGGGLIAQHEYTIFQFFVCFAALITGAQIAGTIFAYAPGMSRAITAASDLRTVFERSPVIDNWDSHHPKVTEDTCSGRIEFRNVSFSYPSRSDHLVVDRFNITVEPGMFVALVGPSGSGKSTLVALIERFFDPTLGQILLDDRNISELDVNSYRSTISLVGQETTLYSGTIKDNLLLGAADDVSDENLVQACKDANIYDVITSLPHGFSTDVGSKGVMLSGGQRQRLAIARALLRNSKILLLDEATSALDSSSEALVQQALSTAAKKRTTIAVAHRLSTIQHADKIYVLEKGKIVESGNHSQLMAHEGLYRALVSKQNLED